MKTILTALVGSRAHGLDTPESDRDVRGVFVAPTSQIILEPLVGKVKDTSWLEGEIDDTSYELGKFLKMATSSNPSVLEILGSPEYITLTEEGKRLQELLPHLWSAKGVRDAFGGYAHNQVKKMMENKDGRRWSYAKHYIRTLVMGVGLLETDELTMVVPTQWRDVLLNIRDGNYDLGAVINMGEQLNSLLDELYEKRKDKKVNLEPVKDFLVDVRKNNW